MGSAHARAYMALRGKDVELAAVFSRDSKRAKTLAKEVGAAAMTRPERILADDSIDAIDVCLPSALHRRFTVSALEHGKHVVCETPMALSLADADAMINSAKRNRRILTIAQVMRFVAPYVRARKEVASGHLGSPATLVARRLSRPYWSRARRRSFRVYGEPLVELSVHDFDVANWFLGRPESVLASGVVDGTGAVVHSFVAITYRKSRALVEGSATMPSGFPFTTALRVQCERGVVDLQAQFIGGTVPTEQFHLYSPDGRKSVKIGGQDPYYLECLHFVRCVQKRADPGVMSPQSELEALRVAFAARQSIRNGRLIHL